MLSKQEPHKTYYFDEFWIIAYDDRDFESMARYKNEMHITKNLFSKSTGMNMVWEWNEITVM